MVDVENFEPLYLRDDFSVGSMVSTEPNNIEKVVFKPSIFLKNINLFLVFIASYLTKVQNLGIHKLKILKECHLSITLDILTSGLNALFPS